MNYFGTELNESGHFFKRLSGNQLVRSLLRFQDLPFNPESLPVSKNKNREKGDVEFYNAFGYSILAIEGSCSDQRGATKSIFWLEKIITYEMMMEKLWSIPVFKEIIDKMPFDVKWDTVILE